MEYTYLTALSYHKFFAFLSIFLTLLYFGFILLNHQKKGYAKRIRLFLPLYYLTLASIISTGFLLLAILKFRLNFSIALMILAVFAAIGLSAAGFKSLKKAIAQKNYAPYRLKMAKFLSIILILLLGAAFI